MSSLSKNCNSLQPCFFYKDNLLLIPVVSSEGSLTGSEHHLVKILLRPRCMQRDFRNCKWVISSPTPRKIKETVEKEGFLHRCKPSKFVTDVTCTTPWFAWMNSRGWEPWSGKFILLMFTWRKKSTTLLLFLGQKHETIIHYVKHWCRKEEEKKSRFWLNLEAHWMNPKAGPCFCDL